MLRFFRGFAKSWFGPAIMGVLVVAFAIFGSTSIRGVLNGGSGDAVVSAGSRTVSEQQFRQIVQQNEQQYQQKTGQPFPIQEAIKEGYDQSLVDKLADQTAYAEMLARSGIRPTGDVVAVELKREAESGKSPGLAQVFDSVTGKFRPAALQQLLQANGLTEAQFERELTDDIADQDFGSAIGGGFLLPRTYAAIEAALLLQSRDVTYFVIPETSVPPPPPPTDAQLNALIQKFKDRLMLPERRTLTVVRFSAKALAPSIPISPAAVEQQFEAKKASYVKPELRSLVEIPLNNPSDAAKVEAALKAGEDPNAVAKSVGVDAIAYTDQPETAIADRKAAAAAFAMQAGQVSGPVQGDFRTVVLKVTKVTPPQAPDLAAARSQIQAELQQNAAIEKVYDLSQKFEDLRQGGASFTDAANKLGLTTTTVGPITQDGRVLAGAPPPTTVDQKVLATAFQLPAGGASDVEQDTDKGEFYAVQVGQVMPPSLPKLDEPNVRNLLTAIYDQQTIVGALQQKAAAAQAAIQKGQSFAEAAAPYHAVVSHQIGLQQSTAQQYQKTYGKDFIGLAFEAKPGQVFVAGSDPLKGMIVARVDSARAATPQQIAAVIQPIRQKMTEDYFQGLEQSIHQAAVQMIKPKTNLALARTALGVDASTAPGAGRAQGGAGTGR